MRVRPEDRRHLDLICVREAEVYYDPQNNPCPNVNSGYIFDAKKMECELSDKGFGDEYFFFEDIQGNPKYERAEHVWEEFIKWMRKRLRQMASQPEEYSYEKKLGKELIELAKVRNAHSMYILMKRNWVEFRDPYLCVEGCPDSILEFVRGIMYEKMTEKQMWGGDEERMPGGTVIIFDKSFMPKEGEDTGNFRFEYRPNYVEEMLKKQTKT